MNKETLAKMLSPDHKPELNEKELKDRMNFRKMLGRQEEQVKSSNHIKSLLGNGLDLVNKQSEISLDDLQQYMNIKFGNIQKTLKTNQEEIINYLHVEKPKQEWTIDLKNKNLIYGYIASLILAVALTYSLLPAKIVTKEVFLEPKKEIIPNVSKVEKIYFSQKFINLRSEPSSKGRKITTLPPNSTFHVLDNKFGWFKISYKDHLKNKSISAWVYGESISPIKE